MRSAIRLVQPVVLVTSQATQRTVPACSEKVNEQHCQNLAFSASMWYSVSEGRVQWLSILVAVGGGSMCELAIKIPDAVLYDTRMTKEQALSFARRAIALGYYTQYRQTGLAPEGIRQDRDPAGSFQRSDGKDSTG